MIFKCEACNHYKDGAGDKTCLSCQSYKNVGGKQKGLNDKVEYYEDVDDIGTADFSESMWPVVAEHPVWPHLRSIKVRKATILLQYHCLHMKPKMIAQYNSIGLRLVYKYLEG